MHFKKRGKITRKWILHVNIINKYLTTVGENLCDVLLCPLRVAQQRHQMRNHSDILKKIQKSSCHDINISIFFNGNTKELLAQAIHTIVCQILFD